MNYQDQTIDDILSNNFTRLESNRILNKALLFIIIETQRCLRQVTKTDLLKEFKESKHTINSIIGFMDGLGFIEVNRHGKESFYTITKCGVRYLDKFLATDLGDLFYKETGYDKKAN